MLSQNDKTFSTFLKTSSSTFVKAGLLDQPLMRDAPYYIDVFKIKGTTELEFIDCYDYFISYFTKFFKLLKKSKSTNFKNLSTSQLNSLSNKQLKSIVSSSDVAFKGAFNLLKFSELDGFNLGYSKTLTGKGIGLKFKMILIHTAYELLDSEIDDPEVFCLLPFMQEGIGCDRISDAFISISHKNFLKYTERKLKELDIEKTKEFDYNTEKLKLIKPSHFKHPLILIPKKYVTSLPFNFCWSDIFNSYNENSVLRDKLNNLILSNYQKNNKEPITKSEVSQTLKKNPDLLKEIVSEFKETIPLTKIEEECSKKTEKELKNLKLPKIENFREKVKFVLDKFKWFVEKKALWRSFYHEKKPLSEAHIQRAFFIIAELLCERFEISVISEADTGIGKVDFKFIDRRESILLEIKLTTNKRLKHGFVTQLSEYIDAEKPVYSYFLVVIMEATTNQKNNADIERYESLIKLRTNISENKYIYSVDARPKVSASKKC